MSGFLLDTNIPSELTRLKSAPEVERWLDKANNAELYFSVISLGEILKGITVLPASKRRDGLLYRSGSTALCGPGLKAGSCR
jgi:predicted nucleic acid-binding protein